MAARIRFDGTPAVPHRSGMGIIFCQYSAFCGTCVASSSWSSSVVYSATKAVRLDEIGEHVTARSVAPNAPRDVEAVLRDAAGTAHQPVDVRQLVSQVIERGSVVAEDRHAVVVRAATQELDHVCAVGELEAENVDEKRDLVFGARAIEDDVADLGGARAVQHDARMLHAIR